MVTPTLVIPLRLGCVYGIVIYHVWSGSRGPPSGRCADLSYWVTHTLVTAQYGQNAVHLVQVGRSNSGQCLGGSFLYTTLNYMEKVQDGGEVIMKANVS